MRHLTRIYGTKAFIQKASLAISKPFPAWIDSSEGGVTPASVMPRVRDSLVLRLVAGRRSMRARTLLHATGSP